MKIDKYIKYIALSIGYMLMCINLYAQDDLIPTTYVVDEYGQPVSGAVIVSELEKNQFITTNDGGCKLVVDDGSSFITVRAIGFMDSKIPLDQINGESKITLDFDAHNMGGLVNLGYNSYSRESLTGAVSSVTGKELDKTPSNILSETMTGRLPGLTNIQYLSELTFFGYANYAKIIRGISSINGTSPLVIIDGVVCPTQYYEFISPKEIESISVLKDASATAIYGMQGANGVIVINTKRGFNGEKKVEAYVDQSFQQMIKRPGFINSARYAELRNEAGERDGWGAYSQFSQDEIDQFRAGDNITYPNNDWVDQFVKEYVLRQRVGVNVSGGSERFRYFSELNFVNQEEPLIVEDELDRDYDPTPRVNIFNFRSNMDVTFNEYVSGFMRLAGSVKREKQTGGGMNWSVYSNILRLPPTMYGPLSPEIEDDPEMSNQVVTIDGVDNPAYGLINRSGYQEIIETNVIAQAGLNVDLKFITEGLSINGAMAYQAYLRNETQTHQNFQRVVRGNDFSVLDNFTKYKTWENTPLSYGKSSIYFYYLDLVANLEYKRQFGDHSINANAHTYYLYQERETVGTASDVLPYKRQNYGVSALYGYKDRYFLKADLGYSGSEQFHPDNRFVATPSISAAWIASKEDFFNVDAISLMKLRASYGKTANDQIGGARFLYLDNIRSSGAELERGNPDLSPELIKKLNVGVDLGLFNAVTIGVDYFKDKVDNMLVNSASKIPVYQGIPLGYYPKLNNGEMENEGYEISLGFNKQFNKDLAVFAMVNFMQAKNKIISINESPLSEEHAYRYRTEGYSVGQQWGYKIDYSNGNGMFNSENELINSDLVYSFGYPRLGDFIYQDLNNDNIIDDKDLAPMGYSRIPEQEYSFTGGVDWKDWEFSFLFQGVRNCSQFVGGVGVYEDNYQGVYSDMHLNAWTPERYANGEEISFPALSLSPSTNHVNNDFFLADCSYLRLRNIEIARTFPINISKKSEHESIRIAFNAQNLFTIDNMPSDYLDPEIGSMTTFNPYRVYNIGVNINF